MTIVVLQNNNPFATNSAYANRIRGLLEGLAAFNVSIKIFITGGYNSHSERVHFGISGVVSGIYYEYLIAYKNYTLWDRRINRYLLSQVLSLRICINFKMRIKNISNAILWPSDDLSHLKAINSLHNKNNYFLFYEMVEFPDIHKNRKETLLRKIQANRQLKYFEKRFLPHLNGIAFITRTLLNHYSNSLPSSVKLLHLPMTVDLERFHMITKNEHPKEPYIAYVGSMSNEKDGIDILLESFIAIANSYKQYSLHLYGSRHHDSQSHLEKIAKSGLSPRIHYNGSVSREQINSILINANILVLPRPDSHQARGGFPTKLGEYLATGNPVCATKVGELPDYLEDEESVFFAEPGSVNSFAKALQRALNNPDKAKKVGYNGRKIAETSFNNSNQARTLFKYFNDTIKNEKSN